MPVSYPRIILKRGKEEPVLRFHPWIFSGAIKETKGHIQQGSVVEVFSDGGMYLATGHFMGGSLAVKLFSFLKTEVNDNFWKEKILQAFRLRQQTGLAGSANTNVFRLASSEGDGLPGLIIDIYATVAVVQFHSLGMYNLRNSIVKILNELPGLKITAVYSKSAESLFRMTNVMAEDGFLSGKAEKLTVLENGNKFEVDFISGQKTGFFVDQRENRKIVGEMAEGRKVLNMFGYTGGFSVYALAGKAEFAYTVDVSAQAIEAAANNLKLNGFDPGINKCIVADAKMYLNDISFGMYDLMILDPPAYAKNVSNRQAAIKGYRNLNSQALRKIAPGGLLFTFSCSQVVDRQGFYSAITAAAVDAGRTVRIVKQLAQPADHPINIFHQEGEYLKGLVLDVE